MLRVALLCSHRLPGLASLLADPNRESLYQIVCCLTSEESSADFETAEKAGIPSLSHPLRFFHLRPNARLTDLELRKEYDARTARALQKYRPDLIFLAGYLYILTEPMLSVFDQLILNIHHSDLTLTNRQGEPRYIGLRSVRDAILAGEPETRATVHLVTPELDGGPLLLRSWGFPVSPLVRHARKWEAMDILKAYSFAHQEWMIRSAWGPLMARSIELVATGRVRFERETASIDRVPGPWDLWSPDHGLAMVPPRRVLAVAR